MDEDVNADGGLREKSNDTDVTLEEYLDTAVSDDELKRDDDRSDASNFEELAEECGVVGDNSIEDPEVGYAVEDEVFLQTITTTFVPSTLQIRKLTCIERPWDHPADEENFNEADYELFCNAIHNFSEKDLEEKARSWLSTMEMVLPTLCSSVRHYAEENHIEYEEGGLEDRLCDWVEFGLSEGVACYGDVLNETHLRIGCRIAERLFVMRPRHFAFALIRRHVIHRLIDLVNSRTICSSTRSEAARALFASLFYWEASAYAIFEQVETDGDGVTPYVRIIKLLLQGSELPMHVVLRLRSIAEYCAFLHWLTSIRSLARDEANGGKDITRSAILSASLKKTTDFIISWRKKNHEQQCFIYRSLHDSGILQSLCLIATSTKVRNCVRQDAIRLLRTLVDFSGGDITGAVFLAHTTTQVASLVLKILVRSTNAAKHALSESESSSEKSILPHALHALQLIDNLALANQRDDVDCEERISALHGMLMLSVTAEGVKALIAALAYASSMEYLLEVFTFGSSMIGDEPLNDEVKARMRHSASYGYACEILFTLACLQSDGSFWRVCGVVLCRLIDSSFISAATSLKQWTDPLRFALAQTASTSSLHFLLQRLASYGNKFASGDPPFATITVLRLLNALLDEHYDASNVNRNERYYEIISMFYDEDGLQQVVRLLKLANAKRSPWPNDSRAALSGDFIIYVALVYPSLCLIHKVHKSFLFIRKLMDVSAMDALVDTYAVCAFGTSHDHIRIRQLVITNLALFATVHPSLPKSPLFVMLERLFSYGLSQPSTFLAAVDIVRRLLPRPLPSTVTDRLCETAMNTISSSRNYWMEHMLLFKHHISFIVLLGTSTSRVLRSHIIALCIRFAHLGANAANFIALQLLEQALRALAVCSQNAVLNALEDQSDEEGSGIVSEEVRFGAATDYTTAAMVALMATCLRDIVICMAFTDSLASRSLFVTTTLKFFNVASHKTTSHVVFQKHLIKVFVEICRVSNDGNNGIPILRHDLHLMICIALCEHITHNEQSLDTVIPALKALITIGNTSKYTRSTVQKAFISRPGSLTRFVRRLEATSDCSSSVLNVTIGLLLTLLEGFFKSAALRVVLQWPLPVEEPCGEGCAEHPLLRLTALLRESTDFEWSSCTVPRLESILNLLEKSFESNAQGNECVEEATWSSVDDSSRYIERAIIALNAFSRSALRDKVTTTLCDPDFDPPVVDTDVKQIADEFLPVGTLDKKSDTSPAMEEFPHSHHSAAMHSKRTAALWKGSGRTMQRRKRIIARSNLRSSQGNATLRKRRK